jgi:hypothetical protein
VCRKKAGSVSNGMLLVCIVNGWHFYFKSVASEYLILKVVGIRRKC